ncbi:NAD-dependent epimerase/dehydratase family protein [Pseudomonas putida]|uniref:NAD-dependent epimerase/dehydratase family protein n=1 Tax=Pseudomonas putida TaxID=303 RepID=UPI0023636A93|nr:NAD(P)-dependent oxidoreductase [Pseudomonas putida]MDD2002083.1 NAD(P)-dependent oxidoreductase [Pseudomonas putida]
MAKAKLLITGAAGRVGSLLRPILIQNYDLRLADIFPIQNLVEGEEAVIGDLSDSAVARHAMEGVSGVIHLAAAVAPNIGFTDTLNPNYIATLNLLDECRTQSVKRMIFASSHHAIGLHPISKEPYGVSCDIAPDGFYGLSKAFGEAACAMYAHRFGISCLAIRIGNADPQVVDGRRERLWTSGEDLARLIEHGLNPEFSGFHICYGISKCPSPILRNPAAITEHYEPADASPDNRSDSFRAFESLSLEEGRQYVGGYFATVELPRLEQKP